MEATAEPIYQGTLLAALSIHNSPVLFQDKVSKVLSATDGGIRALTPDRSVALALSHLHRELDRIAQLRSELPQEYMGNHLGTHDELTATKIVELPEIDGSLAQVPAQEV